MPELTESAEIITDLVSSEHAQTNWVSRQKQNKDSNSGENQSDQEQAASIQSEFSIPLYTFLEISKFFRNKAIFKGF